MTDPIERRTEPLLRCPECDFEVFSEQLGQQVELVTQDSSGKLAPIEPPTFSHLIRWRCMRRDEHFGDHFLPA